MEWWCRIKQHPKEIDDLISNNKELLLDIYKENDSSGDLKPYLNEFDR